MNSWGIMLDSKLEIKYIWIFAWILDSASKSCVYFPLHSRRTHHLCEAKPTTLKRLSPGDGFESHMHSSITCSSVKCNFHTWRHPRHSKSWFFISACLLTRCSVGLLKSPTRSLSHTCPQGHSSHSFSLYIFYLNLARILHIFHQVVHSVYSLVWVQAFKNVILYYNKPTHSIEISTILLSKFTPFFHYLIPTIPLFYQ